MFVCFFYNESLSLHMIVVCRVLLSFLDSIFSDVEDKLEFMGVEIGHELVSSRERIHNYVLYVGLIALMFNNAGLRFYKVLMYNSLFLIKLSMSNLRGSPLRANAP